MYKEELERLKSSMVKAAIFCILFNGVLIWVMAGEIGITGFVNYVSEMPMIVLNRWRDSQHT